MGTSGFNFALSVSDTGRLRGIIELGVEGATDGEGHGSLCCRMRCCCGFTVRPPRQYNFYFGMQFSACPSHSSLCCGLRICRSIRGARAP